MNKSVLMAGAVVVALGVWMSSGSESHADSSASKETAAEKKPLMKVSVLESSLQDVERYVTVQGQVEANRSIDLKVEIEGRVKAIDVALGQRVGAETTILALAEDYRLKQLSEAKAVLRQRTSDYSASLKLKKRGLLAQNQLIADQAAVETARAQLALIQHEVDNAVLKAPFAGVLNAKLVELGDYVQKGNVVGTLVDDEQLKVTGQVPQKNIAGLKLNQTVQVTLSNGDVREGVLSFISRVGDAQSRSYRVEVTLDNARHERLIGLTATLRLPLGQERGHLLPNSVLGLSANGDLEVKVIDDANIVTTVAVQMIRTAENGFWLKGLGDQVRVVTIGKDFVTTGEQVDPEIIKSSSVADKRTAADVSKG
ncbi:MAG: efflux RND transporter periplasmic adaptor subunit [Pseudomonadales bacterium]